MKKILSCIVLMSFASATAAGGSGNESGGGFLSRAYDWVMKIKPVRSFFDYDSSYYCPPPKKWTLSTQSTFSGTYIRALGKNEDRDFITRISDDARVKQSLSLGFAGLSLGWSFAPWYKDNHDIKYNLELYSNMLGLKASYQTISSFKGYVISDGVRLGEISANSVQHHISSLEAYIVPNYRKYSVPAGSSKSYIQKRSAGSLLLGVSYHRDRTHVPGRGDSPAISINSKMAGLGAGYGHNFVLPRAWSLHILCLPEIIVFDSGKLKIDYDEAGEAHTRYDISQAMRSPEFSFNASAACVKWLGNWYISLNFNGELYRLGSYNSYNLTNIIWEGRLGAGFRF